MLKKLTALLFSVLMCLSLLPGQALAADVPDPPAPPAVVESLDPEGPGEPEPPEEPVMPMSEDVPGDNSDYHTS